ncbi:hypothetical protein SAMN05421788_101202 [Filimonas lacunae]|uniref:Uncharacterized protein n=1 Tax=Filimonas lacunae TaxID=477680 RepID=A0A173MM73_9BACT|nr:hypothetical protein [Filimonas lacunae]BAV08745.1 hypothetical protein FLA_4792 [Filimonas lacunae]SIS61021.1 hypothetical protein SAMN05421788_101202 [Filimonas lacunae]
MAKQCGDFIIKDTIGGVNFYIANGQGLARISNPLSSKRVKTAPEFAGLRRYADLLKTASPLASAVYKTLPAGKKRRDYQKLAGKALLLLKAGHTPEETLQQLHIEANAMCQETIPACAKPKKKKRLQKLDKKYAPKVFAELTEQDNIVKIPDIQFMRSRKWNTRRANRVLFKALYY